MQNKIFFQPCLTLLLISPPLWRLPLYFQSDNCPLHNSISRHPPTSRESPNCSCHVLALIINENSWLFQVTHYHVRAEMNQREDRIHFWISHFGIKVQNQNTINHINLFLSRDLGGFFCPSLRGSLKSRYYHAQGILSINYCILLQYVTFLRAFLTFKYQPGI